MWPRILAVCVSCLAVVSLACLSDSPTSNSSGTLSLQVVQGDLQSGPPGSQLPNPLVVKVVDDKDKPVGGQLVNFRVTSGGGSVFAGASLTSKDGIAQELWRLGPSSPDTQRVEVRAVDNVSGRATVFAEFRAVVKLGPPVPTFIHAINRGANPFATYVLTIGADAAHTEALLYGHLDPEPVRQSRGWGAKCYATSQAPTERQIVLLGLALGSSSDRSLSSGTGPWADSLARGTLGLNRFLARFGSDLLVSTAAFEPVPLDSGVAKLIRWTWSVGADGSAPTLTPSDASCPIPTNQQPVATQLAFSVQPHSSFVQGGQFVRVEVQDPSGNVVSNASQPVTVRVGTNATGGSLSGTLTISPIRGIANFVDLNLDKPGSYSLEVTAPELGSRTSGGFNVIGLSKVSAGSSVCAITPSGEAYCWGDNYFGELGNGRTSAQLCLAIQLCAEPPVAVTGGLTFSEVSAGSSKACGVTLAGAAYCWGSNSSGQLGTGTTSGQTACSTNPPDFCSSTPQPVAGGLVFKTISASPGNSYVCGITVGGAAYCWGTNVYGQLGTGSAGNTQQCGSSTGFCSPVPVPVTGGLSFASISSGRDHVCAVTMDGLLYCWGSNCYGQLGNGSSSSSCPGGPLKYAPTLVSGGLQFDEVSASGYSWFTCGVTTSHAAYCWGLNAHGELGSDVPCCTTVRPTPVAGGLLFGTVKAGDDFACGLTIDGAAYCWGANEYGQLGIGSHGLIGGQTPIYRTPVPVVGDLRYRSISTWSDGACAVTVAGAVYCWGGVGDIPVASDAPVAVKGP